jgi:nucleotide-binding universal stress UspA family protein
MGKGAIVVGVDGSSESKAALRWALDEARLRQAKLKCVHAWFFPSVTDPNGVATRLSAEVFETLRDDADELLESVIAGVVSETDADVEIVRSVVEGPPASALIAASDGADLLVVGSRGLGGFRGLLLGSVGQQCVHHANCPVVIVRTRTAG